jgi:hypothetical protein
MANAWSRTESADLGMPYLEYVFDSFQVTAVTLSADLETKSHE